MKTAEEGLSEGSLEVLHQQAIQELLLKNVPVTRMLCLLMVQVPKQTKATMTGKTISFYPQPGIDDI